MINTFSCEDVAETDKYTCLYDHTVAGKAKWQKEGEDVDAPEDFPCNCPELKVADEVCNSFSH